MVGPYIIALGMLSLSFLRELSPLAIICKLFLATELMIVISATVLVYSTPKTTEKY